MKKIMTIVAATLLTCGLLAANAAAAEKVIPIRMGHSSSEDTSLQKGCLKFKEILEASGKFKVQVFPNAQLGGDRELFEAVQNNDVQIGMSTSAPTVNFVPSAVIFDMPFVYRTRADARAVLKDKEFFSVMQAEYAKSGYRLLGYSDMGFRTLTANIKATKPDDLKGLVMRVMENPYHMEIWRAIGTNPTPIPFNELYTALQQGTCDAEEQPIEMMHSSKVYEQQKYAIETNHVLHTVVWLTNQEFYNSLPADHKKIFDDAIPAMLQAAIEYGDQSYDRYVKVMEKAGLQFVPLPDANWQLFADRAQSTWKMIEKAAGPTVFNAFTGARERQIGAKALK
ncbi:Bacterial extracellular solute-binding protein, family 7 [uncultured delta proteobacterium]|uniref:Bacterial extracellular solute-binding protein, family 7 n=1 Tax=uncultured delta proteobacterium TaxID=34034 RepID=A0A212KBP0_9DELT|nr:Bacterial extracellular solute-binding protein, family 7 [uncultured delta proteobacterium]